MGFTKKIFLRVLRLIQRIVFSPLYTLRKFFFNDKKVESFASLNSQHWMQFKNMGDGLLYDKVINFYYNIQNDIGKKLFFNGGQFEYDEIVFFTNLLSEKKNPVIIDIGANIGVHSIRWFRQMPSAQIYAFEPSPVTRKILEQNVAINKTQSIHIFPFALCNQNGESNFFQCQDDAYSSLIDTQRKKISDTFTVKTTKLDDFVQKSNINCIDLIKIDVEGMEHDVVLGGMETFKKHKPDLFIEIYKGKASNPNPEKTINELLNIGYKAYLILNYGQLIPYQSHSDMLWNYYFTMNNAHTCYIIPPNAGVKYLLNKGYCFLTNG